MKPHLQAFAEPLEPLEPLDVPLDVPLEVVLLLFPLLSLLPELDDSEELDGDDDDVLLDWLELLELEPSGSSGSEAKPKLGGIDTARVWQR